MLIINKYVPFSIKPSKVQHVYSILTPRPMVYGLFLVAFSQNRILAIAVYPSLTATATCQAKAGFGVSGEDFSLLSERSTTGSHPTLAGRQEWGKRDLHQTLACLLFKGDGVIHYQQRTTLSGFRRSTSLLSPGGIAYDLCPFNPDAFRQLILIKINIDKQQSRGLQDAFDRHRHRTHEYQRHRTKSPPLCRGGMRYIHGFLAIPVGTRSTTQPP